MLKKQMKNRTLIQKIKVIQYHQLQLRVEDSKPAQDAPTITIVDGGIYVNDGTTFISDEVLAAEAQMLEDTSTEVYGETGYANMKPETVTNNSDALSNRKVQKVKHVSNTFFFQPDAASPMNITVNGKPITFTNSKGEVIPVLPGKELSKKTFKERLDKFCKCLLYSN